MNPRDHNPPHFHAEVDGRSILVGIEDLLILRGRLQPKHEGDVLAWARVRQNDLRRAWAQAASGVHPDPIAPLD